MNYFRVLADPKLSSRWFLNEPLDAAREPLDARDFTQGKPYSGAEPVIVPLQREGKRVPFNFAAFDVPVLSGELSSALREIAPTEIASYPVLVDATVPGFEIVNVLAAEKCLDEKKSEILWWKPEDGRPDRLGSYRMVSKTVIDPPSANGRHILRIKGWEVALIVSELARDRLLRFGPLGVVFAPV